MGPPGERRGDEGGNRSEGEFCEPPEPPPLVVPLVVEDDCEGEEPSAPGGGYVLLRMSRRLARGTSRLYL